MRIIILIIAVIAAILMVSSLFIVKETEYAIKFRLGEILDATYEPGLHWKVPFINNVVKFDRRIITLDMAPEQMNTTEQKYVDVDYYVKWRIEDPANFYTATSGGDMMITRNRMAALIRNDLRDEFASRTLSEVVSEQRRSMMEELVDNIDSRFEGFGINVIDVRIKQIELTDRVTGSVFERMATQRREYANELRSLGREEAEKIRADADRQKRVLLAEARRDSERIRGDGDARATEIYAGAYESDREFYSFYRSLEAYRNTFSDRRDMILLDTESEFFRYFTDEAGASN